MYLNLVVSKETPTFSDFLPQERMAAHARFLVQLGKLRLSEILSEHMPFRKISRDVHARSNPTASMQSSGSENALGFAF
jgi:hypothetical protein